MRYWALILILFQVVACRKESVIIIQGSIQDFTTNEGIENITIVVNQAKTTELFGPTTNNQLATLKTDANGNFTYRHKPDSKFGFSVYIYENLKKLNLIGITTSMDIKEGNNTANFKVKKLIGLKVHLINKSTQNRENFNLKTEDGTVFYSAYRDAIIKDTVLNFRVPRWTKMNLQSNFYPSSGPGISTITFFKALSTENADTQIDIINP